MIEKEPNLKTKKTYSFRLKTLKHNDYIQINLNFSVKLLLFWLIFSIVEAAISKVEFFQHTILLTVPKQKTLFKQYILNKSNTKFKIFIKVQLCLITL